MIERIIDWLDIFSNIVVLILVVSLTFLFWNLTSEFYETPKLIATIMAVCLLLLLGAAKFLISGRLTLHRTILDLPLILILIVMLVSSYFASSQSVALFGSIPRVHGSLISFTAYILLYFVLVANLKSLTTIKKIIYLLTGCGVVISILSILSYVGVNVFLLPYTAALNFSTTGSTFSTTAVLTLLIPFLLIPIIRDERNEVIAEGFQSSGISATLLTKVIFTVILSLFTLTIILIGTLPIYIAALITYGLTLFVTPPSQVNKNLSFLLTPLAVGVLAAALSFLPLAPSKNPLYSQAQNFPRELQLPFITSWKVSVSAFRDSPFWGSGPASYLADFTAYKMADFNTHRLWNVRFDSAFNEYLQFLATLGAPGLIALILLTVLFISQALRVLSEPENSLNEAAAISGITFFVLLLLHPSSLVFWAVGILVLAVFMGSHKSLVKTLNFQAPTLPITDISEFRSHTSQILPALWAALPVLLVTTLFVGVTLYFTAKFTLADYHHRLALNAVAVNNGVLAYNELIAAASLNGSIDLYRSDLAQTNFALANAIAIAKGPTEASPAGSLTEADQQTIQTLLSQSINEGRAAVTLNPNNPVNWEILASIYRQISGVAQNALSFSLDAYGRAIQRDPTNPVLRLTVGGIYYGARNYDLAIRFFTDAANLKPDYANAYYNLAVALRDKGDLTAALQIAEQTVSLLEVTSPDYQVASTLLSSLKDQVASKSAAAQPQASATPPPGALQNQKLPKVLDSELPKPAEVATPPAVKKQ